MVRNLAAISKKESGGIPTLGKKLFNNLFALLQDAGKRQIKGVSVAGA